jgi:hypothetical protein
MSKNNILAVLETAMNNPGSFKSGEYLEEHVLSNAKKLLLNDRVGLIEALCEWVSLKSEPQTMLAISVAKELNLREMRQVIEDLRQEVFAGKIFPKFYLRDIDEALSILLQP